MKSDVRQFTARHGREFVQRFTVDGSRCLPFLSPRTQAVDRCDQAAEGMRREHVLKCHVLASFCVLAELDPPRPSGCEFLLGLCLSTGQTPGRVSELC